MNVPQRYVMLENQGQHNPPPHRRSMPRYDHDESDGCGCMRCCCCCYCCFFLFLLFFIAATGFFFLILNPQVPTYKVENFNMKTLEIQNGNQLHTEFTVVVRTYNGNKLIALDYGKDNQVNITYSNTMVGTGNIPPFLQPPMNTTTVDVVMKGQSEIDSQTQHQLEENQKQGRIPLKISANVPVIIVIDGHSLRQFIVVMTGDVVVDNFQPGSKINILSSNFQFALHSWICYCSCFLEYFCYIPRRTEENGASSSYLVSELAYIAEFALLTSYQFGMTWES